MRALWLPQVLRAAGLTVHEVPGWRTRGNDSWGPVRGITCHHTGGSRNSSVQGEINVLLNGSATAPPPIAQLFLSRAGEWYVVASGLCYHNKVGWDGPNEGYGNDALLGIEAQHSGGDEPWTATQYNSYVRGVAALVRHRASGWNVAVSRVAGHKEHQPGSKSDPSFNMNTFRARVAAEMNEMENPVTSPTPAQNADAVWAKQTTIPGTNDVRTVLDLLRYLHSASKIGEIVDALIGDEAIQGDVTALRSEVSALRTDVSTALGRLETISDRLNALMSEPFDYPPNGNPEEHPYVMAARYVQDNPTPPAGA